MAGFSFELGTLKAGATRLRVESGAADLGLSEDQWPQPIVGILDLERNGDTISVRGRLEAEATLECVRCLKPYALPLDVSFEVFSERAGTGQQLEEEELERGDYMKFHDGRRLDAREAVRETLLVELPIAPHCREDCRGLCVSCGADLNELDCACQAQEAGTRPEQS